MVLTGPGLYTKNLVKLLCNDGHTVTLVGPVTELLQWSSSNLKIEKLGSKKLSQSKVGWMILAFLFARKLRKLEQSGKYDVIHFTDAREALFSSTEKRLVIGNVNDTYIADRKVNPFYYKKYYPADWVIRWAYYNMM